MRSRSATRAFIALLRRHRIALVFADSVSWPYAEDLTADFVYLRLHGSEELYASGYSEEVLDHWAARVKLWARGLQSNDARLAAPDLPPARRNARDVYVYFDNDAKVRAPFDARSLKAKLPPPSVAISRRLREPRSELQETRDDHPSAR
jgi:uncharacterized protein YecE (DUF72 family)